MRVLFVLNKPERELEIMNKVIKWMVQEELQTTTKILDFHENQFISNILEFSPNIIFTFPFSAYPVSTPFYIIKYLLNCHIICFRTEGILNFNSEKHLKGLIGLDRYGSNIVDYELVWGNKAADLLSKGLVRHSIISSKERVKAFGYPNYECYFENNRLSTLDIPQKLRNRIQHYPREHILFFVTGFALADYTREDLIRAGDLFDVNNKNEFEYELAQKILLSEQTAQLRDLWIKTIIETAKKHSDVLFIIKSHPTENIVNARKGTDRYREFENYPNIVYFSEPVSIISVMQKCGIFFHYGSTTAAEAFLLKVPTVLVTSGGIMLDDLQWPTNRTIDIRDLPGLVNEQLTSPLQFKMVPDIEEILSGAFNIQKEHLSRRTPYLPSKDIAEFLLSLKDDTPQQISASDPYLTEAVKLQGKEAIHYLLNTGSRFYESQEYSSALKAFNNTLSLSNSIGLRIAGLHYARALCFLKNGNYDSAEKALLNELAIDPTHKESIDTLKAINTSQGLTNKQSL